MKFKPDRPKAARTTSIPSRRGLGHIRTMTELVVDSSNPQHKYMKLSILSMEKERKVKELRLANQLIDTLKTRLRQIEMESAQLLAELKDQTKFPEELGLNLNADQSGDMNGPDSEPSSGFMLKY